LEIVSGDRKRGDQTKVTPLLPPPLPSPLAASRPQPPPNIALVSAISPPRRCRSPLSAGASKNCQPQPTSTLRRRTTHNVWRSVADVGCGWQFLEAPAGERQQRGGKIAETEGYVWMQWRRLQRNGCLILVFVDVGNRQ
jgi:hypothetical protein